MPSPDRPISARPVEYKGEPLDADRGPGLGCFRLQVAVLAVLVVLTPLSVTWAWPPVVSAALLGLTILLLLVAGQTVIFLLRLIAADRRAGPPRPLASSTKTVGELEDAQRPPGAPAGDPGAEPQIGGDGPPSGSSVRE